MSLRVERRAAWEVVLDRPERANALSAELVEQLHDVLDHAERERPLAVVLRGSDRHFAAGVDLAGLGEETDGSLARRFLRIGLLLERLAGAPYLTVAVVHGAAVGAGADLVAACDHRLAAPAATFGFPGAAFGLVLGTARLASLSGSPALLGGRPVRAVDAGPLVTGEPASLERVLRDWSRTDPATRPALLRAARPHTSPTRRDAALAALARSVAAPGLRDRVAAYAHQTLTKQKEPA